MTTDQFSMGKTAFVKGHLYSIAPDSAAVSFGIEDVDDAVGAFFMPGQMKISRFITEYQHPKVMQLKERPVQPVQLPWQGILMLLIFILLVFSRFAYPRRFTQLLSGAVSNSALFQLIREWNPLKNFVSYLFIISHSAILALAISGALKWAGTTTLFFSSEFQDFFLLFAIVFVVISGKYLTIMFVSWLFNQLGAGVKYCSNQIVFSFIQTLFLLPFMLIWVFSSAGWALMAILVTFTLVQMYRLARSVIVSLTARSFHLFYLFLYLCAFEIVPLLLMAKTVFLLSNGIEIG